MMKKEEEMIHKIDKLILTLMIITILTILSTGIAVNKEITRLRKSIPTCSTSSHS